MVLFGCYNDDDSWHSRELIGFHHNMQLVDYWISGDSGGNGDGGGVE